MIAVIDYGTASPELISLLRTVAGTDYKITINEYDILKADGIILPNISDPISAAKRLKIMNLFSQLRLMNKPVLGLGSGFLLMCEYMRTNTDGLGYFPYCFSEADPLKMKQGNYKTVITNRISLLEYLPEECSLYYDRIYKVPNDVLECMELKEKGHSTGVACDNHYAFQFLPELSGEHGVTFMRNFVSLVGSSQS